jgi:hypothetical protein
VRRSCGALEAGFSCFVEPVSRTGHTDNDGFAAIRIENGGELREEAENVWFKFEFWILIN